jgi:propanol-preferring alcohol dehydrogenase
MDLAPRVPVRTHVEIFQLSEANEALDRLRRGMLRGAAVLVASTAKTGGVSE